MRWRVSGGCALVCVALGLWACGGRDLPVDDPDPPPFAPSETADDTSDDPGAAAGEARVVEAEGASVEIPAGALADDVEIAVRAVAPPVPLPPELTLQGGFFELTPHGQRFAVAVTVRLPYHPRASEPLQVHRLASPTATRWEPVDASFGNQVATFTTDRLSFYVVTGPADPAPDAGAAVTDDDAGTDGGPVDGTVQLAFSPMYSAHDGAREYHVPAIAVDFPDAEWNAADPDLVEVQPDASKGGAILTMRGPGTTTITARKGDIGGSAELHITAATPEQRALGEALYGRVLTYAGTPPAGAFEVPTEVSCRACHGATATALDVEPTPQQTGGLSDEVLGALITRSERPAGRAFHTPFPQSVFDYYHDWDATPQERQALVIYLRSLEPKTQGPLDFR